MSLVDPIARAAYNKEWRIKNIDRVRENARLRELNKSPERKAQRKKYSEENREIISQKRKKFYQDNKERFKRENHKNNHKIKDIIFANYGRVCVCCGEIFEEFLTIDHVDGGGTKHRKEVGEGNKFYRWLIKNNFPEGYQTLCMNCNFAKGKFGQCPHERERGYTQH